MNWRQALRLLRQPWSSNDRRVNDTAVRLREHLAKIEAMHRQWREGNNPCCPNCMFGRQLSSVEGKRDRAIAQLVLDARNPSLHPSVRAQVNDAILVATEWHEWPQGAYSNLPRRPRPPTPTRKACGCCGRVYRLTEWHKLDFCAAWGGIEMRNCPCGNTIALPLDCVHAPRGGSVCEDGTRAHGVRCARRRAACVQPPTRSALRAHRAPRRTPSRSASASPPLPLCAFTDWREAMEFVVSHKRDGSCDATAGWSR